MTTFGHKGSDEPDQRGAGADRQQPVRQEHGAEIHFVTGPTSFEALLVEENVQQKCGGKAYQNQEGGPGVHRRGRSPAPREPARPRSARYASKGREARLRLPVATGRRRTERERRSRPGRRRLPPHLAPSPSSAIRGRSGQPQRPRTSVSRSFAKAARHRSNGPGIQFTSTCETISTPKPSQNSIPKVKIRETSTPRRRCLPSGVEGGFLLRLLIAGGWKDA